jgi:hypothetical protein
MQLLNSVHSVLPVAAQILELLRQPAYLYLRENVAH